MFTSACSVPAAQAARLSPSLSFPVQSGTWRESEKKVGVERNKDRAVSGSKQTDWGEHESVTQGWIILQEAQARML